MLVTMGWEEKWDSFKQGNSFSEIQDACREILKWARAHEEGIKAAMDYEETSGSWPEDCIQRWNFDMQIAGHDVHYDLTYTTDRDGGHEESEGSCLVDGKELTQYSWGARNSEDNPASELEGFFDSLTEEYMF